MRSLTSKLAVSAIVSASVGGRDDGDARRRKVGKRVIEMVTQRRPLLFVGVPSMLLILGAVFFGIETFQLYNITGYFSVSYAPPLGVFGFVVPVVGPEEEDRMRDSIASGLMRERGRGTPNPYKSNNVPTPRLTPMRAKMAERIAARPILSKIHWGTMGWLFQR